VHIPRRVEDHIGCDLALIDLVQHLVPVCDSLGFCAATQHNDLELDVSWETSAKEMYKGHITNVGSIGLGGGIDR
jgi:hypothetical protein